MTHYGQIYIDGAWVDPSTDATGAVIDPTTEAAFASVGQAGVADVDRAVAAARRAFVGFSQTSVADRVALIDSIIAAYKARAAEFADVIAREVGVPVSFAAQVNGPVGHMEVARDLLKSYAFESRMGDTIIRREPIGVCALISPWNWPIQTSVIKLIYAIAGGCTSILKPSDASPLSAILLAKVLHEAGVPAGVFNLIIVRGRGVGEAMAAHPGVDMVSFTGSTGAGVKVGEAAARSIKRTCLELGGKSANVVLPDADLEKAARWNIQRCFMNTGQSCHAPSRMIVHEDQGERLVCGGLGRPEGFERGYFLRPTVFADVRPDMAIATEEIFGPVLAVIPYRTEDEAVQIANDSIFGLGGYVFGTDRARGYRVASQIAAGRVCFNGAATNSLTPMGVYKQSGIGRSMGVFGLEEYLEVKSVYGFAPEAAGLPEHV